MPSSLSEPRWLTADTVIAINEYEVADTGEPFVVLDRGKLDGALGRPVNLFHYEGVEDVLTLAVALLMAIAKAHAFAQGNKRTAYFAAGVFLRANGFDLQIEDHEGFGALITSAVAGLIEPKDLEEAFASYIYPIGE